MALVAFCALKAIVLAPFVARKLFIPCLLDAVEPGLALFGFSALKANF
jgi:hypothetical protein